MKNRDKKHPVGKRASEGKTIAIIVALLTVGGIAIYYLLRWVVDLFFPYLFN